MDLRFTADEEAFRDEVRSFLAEALPEELARKVRNAQSLTQEDMAGWHAALNARGALAVTGPQAHGGPGGGACAGPRPGRGL